MPNVVMIGENCQFAEGVIPFTRDPICMLRYNVATGACECIHMKLPS